MKKSVFALLFIGLTSLLRGQTYSVQSIGNLCLQNHERIYSSAYPSFQTQEINFDSLDVGPNMAAFVCNNQLKFFIGKNNGQLTTPSYSSATFIYSNANLSKGNAVSGRFSNDNYIDYSLVNSLGDIITFKNMIYPAAFLRDSIPNSLQGGHLSSKLVKCNVDGAGSTDLVVFGLKLNSTPSFVVRPFLNTTSTTFSSPLAFNGQNLRVVSSSGSLTNFNYDVEAADFDGNGKDEIVFVSEVLDSIYVLYSQFGYLDKQFQFSAGVSGLINKKVILSDLNGDGKKEICVLGKQISSGLNYVAIYAPIYLTGAFVGLNPFTTVYGSFDMSDFNFADLNADGFKDLVVSQVTSTLTNSGTISIFMHNRSTPFQFANTPINYILPNHTTGGIAVCDVDNNKRMDIISFSNSNLSSIAILKNFTYRDSLFTIPNKNAYCPGDNMVLVNQLIGYTSPYSSNITPSFSLASLTHSVSLTSGGTYTVASTYTPYVGGVCYSGSFPLTLIQGTLPSVVASGPSTVCFNSPIDLLGGGANTYTWTTTAGTYTTNAISFTSTLSSAPYTLTGSSVDGCKASYSGTVNVKPDIYPNVIYIGTNFLCKNQHLTLLASGGATYLWNTGQTTSSIVVTQTAPVSQAYSTTVTSIYGCSKQAFFNTNYNDKCKDVTVITGITPNSDGANDHLYIENIENYPDNVLSVYNRWGKQLFTQKGYDNSTRVWPTKNSGDLISGTYYYVLDLGPGNEVKKGWVEIFSN